MANLRVDKITSTETFETTGSVQFDGTGDQLTIPESTDFQLASSAIDFTIEAWVYGSNFSGAFTTISAVWNQTDDGDQWLFSVDTSGVLGFVWRPFSNSANFISGGTLSTDTWHHVAVTRSGNTFRLFVNGLITASGTNTGTTTNNTQLQIGKYAAVSNSEWEGHISNLRIIKGKALYTENFTPPTRELTVTPETVLLACQHKTDASHEKTGKTITVTGNAVANELTPGLLTDVVKSGGSSAITGSVEFDGSTTAAGGDYLRVDDSGDFDFGTGDFTIEFWMKPALEDTSKYTSSLATILDHDATAGTTGAWFVIHQNNKKIVIGFNNVTQISSSDFLDNQGWHHVAVTRSGTTITVFGNGVDVGNVTSSFDISDSTARELDIGKQVLSSNNRTFEGFLSNLRVVKGTALYTDNFIPPTRELKKVPGTVLLCCQDSNDPTTEATGKTITGYGDLQKADGVELSVGTWTDSSSGTGSGSGTDSSVSITGVDLSNRGALYLSKTVEIGKQYVFSWRTTSSWNNAKFGVDSNDGTNDVIDAVSNDPDYIYITGAVASGLKFREVFTARTATAVLYFQEAGNQTSTADQISLQLYEPPNRASNFTPQVGNDGSVEFVGPTKINTENYFYLPTGDTESRGRGRGVFGWGSNPVDNTIDYVTIQSTGNAIDFGDLDSSSRWGAHGCASATRGLFAGGYVNTPASTFYNIIDYITISSTGNTTTFGELTEKTYKSACCSNSTRGVFAHGYVAPSFGVSDVISYVTIASTGDSKDFGDVVSSRASFTALSSPTRGVFAGANNPAIVNTIDFVTIQSTGNTTDFGDLSLSRGNASSTSNSTRGLIAGGEGPTPTTLSDVIDYITIASKGDAQDFGNLITAIRVQSSSSNNSRAIFGGGYVPSAVTNRIDYVTISSTGDAQDFGDLTSGGRRDLAGFSDSHGGLG